MARKKVLKDYKLVVEVINKEGSRIEEIEITASNQKQAYKSAMFKAVSLGKMDDRIQPKYLVNLDSWARWLPFELRNR